MFAARLYGKEDIRIDDIVIPEIRKDEILVKVDAASICGTDVRMYLNGYNGVDESHPRILGHEFCGRIHRIGSEINSYQEGMRVCLAPNIGCGVCGMCIRGETHQCRKYRAFGINIDGAFAEYLRIPKEAVSQGNICILDKDLDSAEAALNEPLSCAYAGIKKCGLLEGETVLVIGAGPIGMLHAKLAKYLNASKVIITDLSPERLKYIKKDKNILTYVGSDLFNCVMDNTNGKGVDVCIVACPSPQAQADALSLLAFGGRVNFFGGLPKAKEIVALNSNLIHYNELIVTGSSKSSIYQFRKTLGFLMEGMIKVNDLITFSTGIRDFTNALKRAKNGKGLKNIIRF